MKNRDVVDVLERVQAYMETELAELLVAMHDDNWEEEDIQVLRECKASLNNALLRCSDGFPLPQNAKMRVLKGIY